MGLNFLIKFKCWAWSKLSLLLCHELLFLESKCSMLFPQFSTAKATRWKFLFKSTLLGFLKHCSEAWFCFEQNLHGGKLFWNDPPLLGMGFLLLGLTTFPRLQSIALWKPPHIQHLRFDRMFESSCDPKRGANFFTLKSFLGTKGGIFL